MNYERCVCLILKLKHSLAPLTFCLVENYKNSYFVGKRLPTPDLDNYHGVFTDPLTNIGLDTWGTQGTEGHLTSTLKSHSAAFKDVPLSIAVCQQSETLSHLSVTSWRFLPSTSEPIGRFDEFYSQLKIHTVSSLWVISSLSASLSWIRKNAESLFPSPRPGNSLRLWRKPE